MAINALHQLKVRRVRAALKLMSTDADIDPGASRGNCANAPQSPASLRLLLVDDHCIVREGLSLRLDAEPGLKVVGCVASGEEAVVAAERLRPDVVIMDLVLPSLNGIDATRQILRHLPKTLIVALSACHSLEHVRRTLRAGAQGYVLKSAAGNELTEAIKTVSAGHAYISTDIIASYGKQALEGVQPANPMECLSGRERQILQCLVVGLTSAEIAQRLSLSCKTVETYRSRMMLKLGVNHRTALMRVARDYELPEV